MAVDAIDFFNHMDSFLDYRKTSYDVSDQTLKSNLIDLTLFQRFIHSHRYKTISGLATMAFQFYLKKERDNSGGSINRKIYSLRSYSHFLRIIEVPDADRLPFYDILKIRNGYKNRPNALTRSQVKSLFDQIERMTVLGVRDYAVYALMYQTGLRVGEVHSLDLDSIDLENQKLTVIGKGRKRRELHLTSEMIRVLSEYITVRRYLHKSDKSMALFISKKGNRLAIRTMEDNFKKVLKKTEFNTHFNVTCHTLRHSFASHLNDNDVDILVIQSLLGHASARSTEAYIHPSMDKIREAMEKLPAVIYMNQLLEDGVLKLPFQNNRSRIQ